MMYEIVAIAAVLIVFATVTYVAWSVVRSMK